MMKNFILVLLSFFLAFAAYAEDQTPVEEKIQEEQPAPAEKTQVPEEIKKQPLDIANPEVKPAVQGIVSGMEGAGGSGGSAGLENQPAPKPKKKRSSSSLWPDDEKKLHLAPADEAAKNPSFQAFREEFLKKLAQKDKNFLLASISKKLKFSPGGGYSDFKNFYSLDMDAKRSLVWDDITKILKLGGVFTPEGEFCAPYVYCLWPEGVKTSGMVAVVKENVEIKKSPGKSSATVGTVGYEIVKTNYNSVATRAGWTSVETYDGKKGFVPNDAVRDPNDYRAWFKEEGGKWLMTTYISGDF